MVQEQTRLFQRLLFFADLALVALAFVAAYGLRFYGFPALAPFFPALHWLTPPEAVSITLYLWLLPWVVMLSAFVHYFSGLYAPDRALNYWRLTSTVVKATLMSLILVAAFTTFYRSFYVSRLFLLLFGGMVPVAFLGLRFFLFALFKRARRKGKFAHRVLIVGAGPVAQRLTNAFAQYPWAGIEVVGYLDDEPRSTPPLLGSVNDLLPLLDRFEADNTPIRGIYIALPLAQAPRIEAMLTQLSERLAHVYFVPDLFGAQVLNARASDIDGVPVLHLVDEVPLRLGWLAKRLIDIGFSLGVLLALSPVYLALALAVKVSSPGPVFFRQERVSLNGQRFGMLKYRTMRTDQVGDVNLLTSANDPRVTAVGAFLRRTSLDELPQFVNVLKGDMSVVGPRPERTWVVEEMRAQIPGYMLKHKVPAGITGWAQVHGWRGDTSLEKRIEFDLYYIQNWSLKLDLKIMLMTVWKGFVNKNAY